MDRLVLAALFARATLGGIGRGLDRIFRNDRQHGRRLAHGLAGFFRARLFDMRLGVGIAGLVAPDPHRIAADARDDLAIDGNELLQRLDHLVARQAILCQHGHLPMQRRFRQHAERVHVGFEDRLLFLELARILVATLDDLAHRLRIEAL